MKDLHSHILMGIDDGSRSIEESINILKKAKKAGVTDIMLTPHYIKNSKYDYNNLEKEELLDILKREMEDEGININLYLGNEIYIDEDILELIKEDEIMPLNNSRYLLVELPMMSELNDASEIFFELIRNGYIVILAHPERYTYIQSDISKLDEFIEMGVLLQGNYMSLYGKYGSNAENVLKQLLKENKIQFLASDIHHERSDYHLEKLEKHLLKIVKDKEIVKDLLERNFDKVIEDKEI